MEGEGAMERRIRIVGLCLVAVLALCAVASSGAQASTELGRCIKKSKTATGFKGHNTDKECLVEASPEEVGKGGKANKYEWEAGPGGNSEFTSKGNSPTIATEQFEITCKKVEGKGRV